MKALAAQGSSVAGKNAVLTFPLQPLVLDLPIVLEYRRNSTAPGSMVWIDFVIKKDIEGF